MSKTLEHHSMPEATPTGSNLPSKFGGVLAGNLVPGFRCSLVEAPRLAIGGIPTASLVLTTLLVNADVT